MTLTIKVLLFASAREAAGDVSEVSLTMEESLANTSHFRELMAKKYPKLSNLVLDEDSLTLALNEEYIPNGVVKELKNGDTLALIPPISGG